MSYKIVEIPLNIGIGLNGFIAEIHVLKFEVEGVPSTALIPRTKGLPLKTIFGPAPVTKVFKGTKNRETSTQPKFIIDNKNKSK